ncbi:MAG: family oxidoreductase [Deltaproteobacteria bacterium]|nr:family oxidoreductase [Deltaproteobacteria bacterium]
MDIIVITGIGGMGLACARRIGGGHRLLVADFKADQLEVATAALAAEGYDVVPQVMDVADAKSVAALAAAAQKAGRLRALVHTAGLSPSMASAERIYAVDLIGTALVLDAFLPLAVDGTVAVMIASMAGHLAPVPPERERVLATATTVQLADFINGRHADDPAQAYGISKRGNQLRVEAAAAVWAARGARVVSISPGIIATPMGRLELQDPRTAQLRTISRLHRLGTPDDIAAAVEWLISPAASFVNGTDLLIDGGVVATMRWNIAPAR